MEWHVRARWIDAALEDKGDGASIPLVATSSPSTHALVSLVWMDCGAIEKAELSDSQIDPPVSYNYTDEN